MPQWQVTFSSSSFTFVREYQHKTIIYNVTLEWLPTTPLYSLMEPPYIVMHIRLADVMTNVVLHVIFQSMSLASLDTSWQSHLLEPMQFAFYLSHLESRGWSQRQGLKVLYTYTSIFLGVLKMKHSKSVIFNIYCKL